MMRLPDTDRLSPTDIPMFTASSSSVDTHPSTNGRTNGFSTNGAPTNGAPHANGIQKNGKAVAKVALPGSTLYDDSFVDREEFVRLVIQSLRDVGYIESAATLEAESGYTMESSEVSQFRYYILNGMWSKAESALERLGVDAQEGLLDAKFLISQQKYLELLEAKKSTLALKVLRDELAKLNVDSDQLHTLSSLMMCSDAEDLHRRAGWDGASGESRRQLLDTLQEYIPSAVMIPPRRFATLLDQAKMYQQQQCTYHNSSWEGRSFSLYADHRCSRADFPRITTTILQAHKDEVWNIAWSHNGAYLASASKDKTVIIWKRGSNLDATSGPTQDWSVHLTLSEHQFPVAYLAWSPDDTILLTSSEEHIKLWDMKTGNLIKELEDHHQEPVTAMAWLADGSAFISGGLDRKIVIWEPSGKVKDSWTDNLRITDLALTPDHKRLVATGMHWEPSRIPGGTQPTARPPNKLIVWDMATKQKISSTQLDGELTSVQISNDSQYALVNHSPNEIHLWDLSMARIVRRYTGLVQNKHVIRSCFGGIDGNFVVSGSEDSNVYIWHRETGALLEVLSGHLEGSVNSVAWNPVNERMFASCSDDNTIRIWESLPTTMFADPAASQDPAASSSQPEKGKGKTRQRADGNGASSGTVDVNPL